MSDYLKHLVTRTLSPEATVRPQLRSAFEPPPVHDGFTLPPDVDLETQAEPTIPTPLPCSEMTPLNRGPAQGPLNAAPASFPTGDEAPGQVSSGCPPSSDDGMPSREPEAKDIAPVQPLTLTARETFMTRKALPSVVSGLPESIPESARAFSPPPATSRPAPSPRARRLHPAPPSKAISVRALTIPHQIMESEATRLEQTALPPLPPAASVWAPDPPVASVAPSFVEQFSARAAIQSPTVDHLERPSERSAITAIRPMTPATPAFRAHPVREDAPPPPAIHVTIGRVEIRAVAPPAVARANVTTPPSMSLKEYLERRTVGGQR